MLNFGRQLVNKRFETYPDTNVHQSKIAFKDMVRKSENYNKMDR